MQCHYWPDWARFLERRGLTTLACVLMEQARPLFPIAAQMMVLGFPLLKGITLGDHLSELAMMLDDEEQLAQFADYLRGAEV